MHSYHSSPLVGLIASSSWVPLRGEGMQGASMLYLLAVPSWPSAEPLAPCQKHWNKKTTNDPTVLPHASNNPSPHVSAFCVSTLCVCGSVSLQEGRSPSIEVSTRGIRSSFSTLRSALFVAPWSALFVILGCYPVSTEKDGNASVILSKCASQGKCQDIQFWLSCFILARSMGGGNVENPGC